LSRKKGFSKTALRERLEAEGIAYFHFVELGDPKPGRDAARAGRFAEFKKVAMGTVKARPKQWLLLGVIRLDETPNEERRQGSFQF
jgi:hypothetical protein